MKGSRLAVIFILCALLIAGIACGGKSGSPTPTPTATPAHTTVNVNESNSGGLVNLSIGNQLIVTLVSNPGSTGFSWNLSAISNTSVIAKVSDEYITPTPIGTPLIGQGGYENWTFEALAAGTSTISMKYIRSWETEPADTFEITVNVK